jgi:hypothetical protein
MTSRNFKSESNLKRAIVELSKGGSFAQLLANVEQDVRKIAEKTIRGRSYVPMEVDDMMQVILLSIWERTHKWNGTHDVCGYVLWFLEKDMTKAVMLARGFKHTEDDKWVGGDSIPIPMGDSLPEVVSQTTPERLMQQKEHAENFVDTTCYTERETVLVMSALKQGSVLNGARFLMTQPVVETMGLVRDVNWISKAILRALKRARKESNGYQEKDEAQDRQDCGGCEARASEGRDRSQGIQARGQGCEQDVGSAYEAPPGGRVRSRRLSSKPRALVQSVNAC